MHPSVYAFDDFLEFLKDHADKKKSANPRWSFGAWARRLKLSGTASLTMVLNGQRQPGEKLLERFIQYFDFKEDEREYFLDLARLYRHKDDPRMANYFKSQLETRKNKFSQKTIQVIPLSLFHVIAKWPYFAIREMTQLKGFKECAEWIKDRLKFKLSKEDVSKVLQDLFSQGLIEKDKDGLIRPSPNSIDTPQDMRSEIGKEFHSQMFELAQKAMHEVEPKDREYFSMTLTLKKERMGEFKEYLRKFQNDFCNIAEESQGSATYQLNLQFFPLAEIEEIDNSPRGEIKS